MRREEEEVIHPPLTRQAALQAGSVGILGLGLAELSALRTRAASGPSRPKAR
jgi:hypothetical protein